MRSVVRFRLSFPKLAKRFGNARGLPETPFPAPLRITTTHRSTSGSGTEFKAARGSQSAPLTLGTRRGGPVWGKRAPAGHPFAGGHAAELIARVAAERTWPARDGVCVSGRFVTVSFWAVEPTRVSF